LHPHRLSQSYWQEKENAASLSGLHIIANFRVRDTSTLIQSNPFRCFVDAQITDLHLTKVGEVYHEFSGGGYTAVVCLTESHLSVHTWPEHNYLTFDIFLSNYLKDNRPVTQALYEQVKAFFGADVVFEQMIQR